MTINHLIVLCENPVEGKVKERLAAEIGNEDALEVYQSLITHTANVAKSVMAQRKCYYSEFIANDDEFDDGHFEKQIQKGEDFGERVYNAAKTSFGEWASKVVIIGCDCYELNAGIIEEAFLALDKNDVVIGPSKGGSFYLLGLKDLSNPLLLDREWNHENVVLDMLLTIKEENQTHYILPTLVEINSLDEIPDELKKNFEGEG